MYSLIQSNDDNLFFSEQTGEDIVYVFYKQVDFRSVISPPFAGDVHDLAFAFSDDILLACVDQASHLRIYRIEKIDELQSVSQRINSSLLSLF